LSDSAERFPAPTGTVLERLLLSGLVLLPVVYSLNLVSFLHAKESLMLLLLGTGAGWCLLRSSVPDLSGHARQWWPVWLLLGYGLLRGGYAPDGLATAALWAGALLWAWLAGPTVTSTTGRHRLHGAIVAGAVLAAGAAVLEAAGYLSFAGLPPREPLTSLLGNRDLLGGYLALALATALGRYDAERRAHPALLPSVFVLSFALVVSGSRSAWLAAAVGLTVALCWNPPRRDRRAATLYAMTAAGVVAAMLTQPQPTAARIGTTFSESDTGGWVRVWLWDASLRMLSEHGLLGAGLGRFGAVSADYMADALHGAWGARYPANGLPGEHAHNDALELLCETGLPGVALACVFLGILWWRRTTPAAAPLAALAVFSMFNAALFSAPHLLAGVLLVQAGFAPNAVNAPPRAWGSGRLIVLAALALWPAHGVYVLYPSARLAAAESLHLKGDDPSDAYLRAARWPYTRPAALGFSSMHAFDRGEYASAAELAGQSVALKAWPQVLAIQALSLARLGDPAAGALLDEALRQWPVNAQVFEAAWGMADDTRRGALREHAKKWRLPAPAAE
jgi:O-antigen ligase